MPQTNSSLTPQERRLRASIAGLTGWANTIDCTARAKHASQGLYEKCLRRVDPDNLLPEHERARLADSLYRGTFSGWRSTVRSPGGCVKSSSSAKPKPSAKRAKPKQRAVHVKLP